MNTGTVRQVPRRFTLVAANSSFLAAQDIFKSGDLAIAQASSLDLLPNILDNIYRVQTPRVTRRASKLVSLLTCNMPEWYAGEHFHTAQCLISGPETQSTLERFRILIYKTSNGIETSAYSESLEISLFLRSCLMAFPLDLKILRVKSIVLQAFCDNLFKQEVYSRTDNNLYTSIWPLDTIRWLLNLGQNPNCCRDGIFGTFGTSIQRAVEIGDIELIQLLLDCHVRVHGSQAEFELRILIDATMSSSGPSATKLRTLRFLSGYYNFTDWQAMLCPAIHLRDIGFMREILAQDPDVTEKQGPTYDEKYHRWDTETYLEFKSPLVAAALAGDDYLTLMLDHLDGSGRLANSVTTDLLIAAAYGREIGLTRRLLEARTLPITCNSRGATPLQAAVAGGNLPVCKLYLEVYGRVSPALVALAAFRGYDDVLSMLIGCNNCINEPLTKRDFVGFMGALNYPACQGGAPFSILQTTIYQGFWAPIAEVADCLTILIQAGARLKGGEIAELANYGMEKPLRAALAAGGSPDDQNHEGFSALQCALKPRGRMKSCSIIVEILLQARARLVGGEVVTAIRNHDEASVCCLLRHGGTLKDTDRWGMTCLEAEILAQNNGLIQQILEEASSTIDLAPVCAALQMQDRALVQRLLPRLHAQTDCPLMQGTAIGLAAASGYLDVLEELHVRFSRPPISYEALLPLEPLEDHGPLGFPDRKIIFTVIHTTLNTGLKYLLFVYWCKYTHSISSLKGNPLALAALGKNPSGFQRLLEKGCRADAITLTILAQCRVAIDFVGLLKIHQPRLDNISPLPRMVTPLCIAIQKGNIVLANYLVEADIDVNGYDKTLQTSYSPLQSAVRKGNITLMGALLAKGASVNSPPGLFNGLTALQAAAGGGHIGIANVLLQHGARMNARGSRLQGSALELAARSGNIDMLQLLLHHGAITTGPGREQFITAVAYAMEGEHHTAVQFLKGKCGWTRMDQSLLRHLSELKGSAVHLRAGCKNCRTYCCDEIHNTDTPCIQDYSIEEESYFAAYCRRCKQS